MRESEVYWFVDKQLTQGFFSEPRSFQLIPFEGGESPLSISSRNIKTFGATSSVLETYWNHNLYYMKLFDDSDALQSEIEAYRLLASHQIPGVPQFIGECQVKVSNQTAVRCGLVVSSSEPLFESILDGYSSVTLKDVLGPFRTLIDCLALVHEKLGLLHCDLCPENLVIMGVEDYKSSGRRLAIGNWGFAT